MALLIDGPRDRARPLLALALLCAATLGACGFLVRPRTLGLGFDHRLHYEDEGLDCADCHMGVEDSDEPGMPGLRMCQLCHDDETEAEKPEAERIAQLFDGEVLRGGGISNVSDEILFSHLQHATASYECADCHTGIETSTHPADLTAVTMADCMDCHAREGVANECSTCHSEIDRDWPPPSHSMDWTRFHGDAWRAERPDQSSRCDLCHEETSCNQCHLATSPRNHTNYWRQRGHGVAAKMERQDCAVCHRPDACVRCHEENPPRSHRGAFASSLNTHCGSCHFPIRAEGCSTCHRSEPRHPTATPLPPDHNPSRDCRICHGVDAPLPHVDKGDLCVICHR